MGFSPQATDRGGNGPRRLRRTDEMGLHGRRPVKGKALTLRAMQGIAVAALAAYALHAGTELAAVVCLAAGMFVAATGRMALVFDESMRVLARSRRDALTDALTGLGNRRKLMEDLEDELGAATAADPRLLVLLDLDGFKRYNDSFGHPAGDALLARLGRTFDAALHGHGMAYRLGGDEFCALVASPESCFEAVTAAAVAALSERGDGFTVTASHGTVTVPGEAEMPARALQLADERLYGRKSRRRRYASAEQTRDALLQALQERAPDLGGVAGLARDVGRALELLGDDLDVLVRAAELHDVGKVAVPDSILSKTGPLDDVERDFFRQHTIVGERILSAAPALLPVARLVRSTPERWDGSGYPDGLAGPQIPLGSRVIAVCEAFKALSGALPQGLEREAAIEQLREEAGARFDPAVVEVFAEIVDAAPDRAPAAAGRAGAR